MQIAEMHVLFRQLGQQMGMQNVRAILPEQIDELLNASISDTVNAIVKNNVAITSQGVGVTNSKIGELNALRTLHKIATINLKLSDKCTPNVIFEFCPSSISLNSITDCLYYSSFDVCYINSVHGYGDDGLLEDLTFGTRTRYFKCRIIEDDNLGDVLNDDISKPTIKSPIITIKENNLEIYNKSCEKKVIENEDKYFIEYPLIYHELRVGYIKKPATVKYSSTTSSCVNCDLPDHLHVDIVKYAVDLYFKSVAKQSAVENKDSQQQTN